MSETIFVAVHGIGDQVQNETIQAVARRVYRHFAPRSASPPLGAFHSDPEAPRPAYFPGLRSDRLGEVGFAEVYWAAETRAPATEGYTLEEARRWAATLVERLRARKQAERLIDFDLLEQILGELIETIAVTDRLLSLARKANLGDFDLKRILDQFLGDVQFFTDFSWYRQRIVGRFNEVLTRIHDNHPEAEIVLIAHSEGTVVAFTGLLLAAAGQDAAGKQTAEPAGWLPKVRALMTLGSPIDKHLVLWPEIWREIGPPVAVPAAPISWWNYYDHGDPVGFELDTAREWLTKRGFAALFDFDDARDCGFTRYPFPGKSHVDYWTDDQLFGHFFATLRRETESPPYPRAAPEPGPEAPPERNEGKQSASAPAAERQASKPSAPKLPGTRPLTLVTSYLLPYVVTFAVLFLAVYALTKGAHESGYVEAITFPNLLGYSALLAGVTILARVPRLVRRWWRWLVGGAALALAALGYGRLVSPKIEIPLDFLEAVPLDHFVLVGLLVALASVLLGKLKAFSGMRPLVVSGTVAAMLMVVLGTTDGGAAAAVAVAGPPATPQEASAAATATAAVEPSFWPILVGGAFFLYLWWLAALLFDLVFVWHRNIRHSAFIESG